MMTTGQLSDTELEQEFQNLAHLESESLIARLGLLRNDNPALFEQLVAYVDRRRTGVTSTGAYSLGEVD
jgi:hypothetical protein